MRHTDIRVYKQKVALLGCATNFKEKLLPEMEVSCKVYSELQFVACYGKNISLSLSET